MFKNSKVEYSPYSANAPMWSDFGSSPNISSDYFEYYHPETETPFSSGIPEKIRLKNQEDDKMPQTPKIGSTESQEASSNFIDAIDTMNMTPVKVVSPKSKKGQAPIVVKETTVKDVVNDVLAIVSSATKPKCKAVSLNKTQGVVSESNKTPPVTKKRATRSMHFSDAKKTPVPKVSSASRKSMAAGKDTTVKLNNSVSDAMKNDAGVPLSKIIRTPIFIHKKTCTAEIKPDSIAAANSAATDQASTTKPEGDPLRLSLDSNGGQETDNDVTIKADPSNDPALSPEADDYDNLVSSTPAVKPSSSCKLNKSALSVSKIKSTLVYSNPLEKFTSSTSTTKVVITSDNAKSSTLPSTASAVASPKIKAEKSSTSTEPEKVEEGDDDDYEDVFEQVEDFEYFQVKKARFVEKRKPGRGQQPTVLTSHARRRSSLIKHRRHSNQYISLAEAVTKFQRGTPTRFHTVSAKNPKPKALQVVKQQALRPTIPVSPALTSKHRARRNVILSRAEIEELEMREIKQHPIRANPVPKTILQAPQPLKVVPKKPLTAQRPFHLSKPKNTVPKNQVPAPSTCGPPVHSKKMPVKTVVPSVLNSADGVTITETEINHFGIPVTQNALRPGSAKKKTTQPCPFNFEVRNKLFMSKREERLKKLQSEEAQKAKVEFHARPMPASLKKVPKKESAPQTTAPKTSTSEKPQEVVKPKVLPFSFEERDKQMLKKREELRKKIEEKEKKARTFHANPAPHFKPVMVRGRSKESLKGDGKNPGTVRNRSMEKKPVLQPQTRVRSAENLTIMRSKSDENMKPSLPRKSSVPQLNNQTDGDQENRAPNRQLMQKTRSASAASGMPTLKPKLKPLPVELHSDKRAKMRKEFDEQIKMKCALEEAKRKREQEERLAKEQAEINEMRRKAEPKARPMPVYKPMVVVKSAKPLTAPESPAWAKSTR